MDPQHVIKFLNTINLIDQYLLGVIQSVNKYNLKFKIDQQNGRINTGNMFGAFYKQNKRIIRNLPVYPGQPWTNCIKQMHWFLLHQKAMF